MKYPWWERWASLTNRPYPDTPAYSVESFIQSAAWFVENYACEAELYGWRPIHIMRPGVGLAWRWRNVPDPHVSIDARRLVADHGGILFAYAPLPDGGVNVITGPQRDRLTAYV